MRKMLTLCLLMYVSISCNNPAEKATVKTDSTGADKPVYAYTIKKPDNWDVGSSQNTAVALNALKAFENNKIDESMSYFADTVDWKSDYIDSKFPKDSLKAMFGSFWNVTKTMKIEMNDFESVISKDKKDEYVTLWYKQTTTDAKGKTDSVAVINDFKISHGKIVALDEAMRHLKAKK